ncbi:acetate/propionate family kinase [Methylophaga sulfidovorans]|uniref:Acetate kinase n=1 Tax=Methylophaga sulfidovorans TaxID=45496 RepID=A0A1I4A2Q8_9GAMM|nr:acetate/propionate family kinase [Methylophaga sulfidovorans]SFK50672.1 acetate kinase [Methylophaga sulfidovorans]
MTNQHVILVLNSGSSSVKYKLIQLNDKAILLEGQIQGIGDSSALHSVYVADELNDNVNQAESEKVIADHQAAFEAVAEDMQRFFQKFSTIQLKVIAHRVVHGGAIFFAPVELSRDVLNSIESYQHLAPQHLPGNIAGIKTCQEIFFDVRQFAVFDTDFHQTIPEHIYRYAVPDDWYKNYGVRRYGFHGLSHQYVAQQAAHYLDKPLNGLNLISLHLGNGASACAIKNGQSFDTSMGFTPLQGLMMGNRSGDLDAAVPLYIQEQTGISAEDLEHQLNFESGLVAITGTHDMAVIQQRAEQGDKQASLAIQMYVHQLRRYIGAYLLSLGRVDALIFTGGIGENASMIRELACDELGRYGVVINSEENKQIKNAVSAIHHLRSDVPILVIKTDEEKQIATNVAERLER